MTEASDLTKLAEVTPRVAGIARSYFRKFPYSVMELDDMKQEGLIAAWKVIASGIEYNPGYMERRVLGAIKDARWMQLWDRADRAHKKKDSPRHMRRLGDMTEEQMSGLLSAAVETADPAGLLSIKRAVERTEAKLTPKQRDAFKVNTEPNKTINRVGAELGVTKFQCSRLKTAAEAILFQELAK